MFRSTAEDLNSELASNATGPAVGPLCHAAPADFRIANRGKIDQSVECLSAEWESPGPGQYSMSSNNKN